MIQRGDPLRAPYTGIVIVGLGIFDVRIYVSFVLSGTYVPPFDTYLYQFNVLYLIYLCLVVRFSELVVKLGSGSIVRS